MISMGSKEEAAAANSSTTEEETQKTESTEKATEAKTPNPKREELNKLRASTLDRLTAQINVLKSARTEVQGCKVLELEGVLDGLTETLNKL